MLTDKQLERYADVMLWALKKARKQKFRAHDIVLLRYDPPALPLAEKIFSGLMSMGVHPVLTGILPTLRKSHLELDNMTPHPRYAALNDAMNAMRGGA